MPKVSIGMPVYNGEKFLREALDSLLAQTFDDFEIIISDNASVDNTPKICLEYVSSDARVSYVRQELNIGAIANFKYVLNMAKGEFFMWAAADDVWDHCWIEVLLPLAQGCDALVFGRLQNIGPSGQFLWQPRPNAKFDFSGIKIFRRVAFYMATPGCGKANPIYGLSRTSTMRSLDMSILYASKDGSDMLFLYHLLSFVPILSSSRPVRLYKRIHEGCAGRPDASPSASKLPIKLRRKFFYLLARVDSVLEPIRRCLIYSRYSSFAEKLALCSLLPFLIISNFIFISKRYFLGRRFC